MDNLKNKKSKPLNNLKMKKIILTLAVAFSTLCSFASDVNVNSKVLDAFKNDFVSAKEITWTATSDYYKASFLFNDQQVAAFYNMDGELMGMTRYIRSTDLPLSLQANLKKEYGSYWISDLFEVSNHDGTGYYITLENADSKIVLKSSGDNWRPYQKKTTKA
jgi:CRISPR/Cas system-associated exonuclease Cas4 (RecB family)